MSKTWPNMRPQAPAGRPPLRAAVLRPLATPRPTSPPTSSRIFRVAPSGPIPFGPVGADSHSCRVPTSNQPPHRSRSFLVSRAAAAAGTSEAGPPLAPIVEPSRLVAALDKLARAGHVPEPRWLDMYLAACQPALPLLAPRELASLVRSLTRLGLQVPEVWAQALLQAASSSLSAADTADDVAELLTWMAADIRVVPEAAVVGAALQQVFLLSQAGGPAGLSPGKAADVAWAVARLGYRPADPLLDCLAAATLGQPYKPAYDGEAQEQEEDEEGAGDGDGDDAGDTSSVGGSSTGLGSLPAEQLVRLAWAFASYNYFPSDDWVKAYLLEGIYRRGLSPEGATAVLWNLGCMQLPVDRLWLQAYYATTTGRLREIPAEGLVNALWAIAACREVERVVRSTPTGGPERQSASGSPSQDGPSQGPGEGEGGAGAQQGARDGVAAEDDPGDAEAAQELDGLAAAQLRRNLAALMALGDRGTEAQRRAVAQLQAALERRLERRRRNAADGGAADTPAGSDGNDGLVTAASPVPAAWAAEWYETMLPYMEYLDKALLVKTMWALAALELAPPAGWVRRLAVAAKGVLLAEGPAAAEPLELLYGSRSADTLLVQRRALPLLSAPPPRTGVDVADTSDWKAGEEGECAAAAAAEEEEAAREALARFAAESFALLSRQQLPAAWRRLNPRFPPYAQPRPGSEVQGAAAGGAAAGGGAGPEVGGVRGGGRALVGPEARSQGTALQPFR